MKIIVGLGNPGTKYENTRHNAGFMFMDYLAHDLAFEAFTPHEKMAAQIAAGVLGEERLVLVKPETFMNESGRAVSHIMQFYKLLPKDLAVIHDDMDIATGTFRSTTSSRAAGHNGVQNIIDTIGSQEFFRIRLGISRPSMQDGVCISAHAYVLQEFSGDELSALTKLFPEAKAALLSWIQRKK